MTISAHWLSTDETGEATSCTCGYIGSDLGRHFREARTVEAGVIARMPNKPKTPMHSFRVEDELWEAAKKRAAERGETLTEALRKFLRRYSK